MTVFEIGNKAINLYMGHTGDLLNGVNDNGSCDTLINTDINSEDLNFCRTINNCY